MTVAEIARELMLISNDMEVGPGERLSVNGLLERDSGIICRLDDLRDAILRAAGLPVPGDPS